MRKIILYITLLASIIIGASCSQQEESKIFLFVGSYTEGEEREGIYVYELDVTDGSLKEVEREGNLINPSFLTISPNGKYLYACTDTRLESHGSVSAFKIDSLTGKITFLNKQTAGGRNPVHVVVDKNSEYVVNSSYTDAGISIFKCAADGSLNPYSQLIEFEGSSIVSGRQDEAHVHSANFSYDNRFLFAPDLGADKIRVLTFSNSDLLTTSNELEIQTKEGSGPRHFTFHPNNKFAYCIEELSGTVSAYQYENGQLEWLDTYFSYSQQLETYASADIHISPDGKFLYASNRLDDENTLSIFSIDETNGKLELKGHQSTFGNRPRSFVIDPTGQFLIVANQDSNSIVVFKRNQKSGLLTKVNDEVKISLPSSLKMRKYQK